MTVPSGRSVDVCRSGGPIHARRRGPSPEARVIHFGKGHGWVVAVEDAVVAACNQNRSVRQQRGCVLGVGPNYRPGGGPGPGARVIQLG